MPSYLIDTNIIGILTRSRDHRRKRITKFINSLVERDKIIISETVLREVEENPQESIREKELRVVGKVVDDICPVTTEIEELAEELEKKINERLKEYNLVVYYNDMEIVAAAALNKYKLITADHRTLLKGKIMKAIKDVLKEKGLRIEMWDPSS